MAVAPEWLPKEVKQGALLEIAGIIFGTAYAVVFALCVFAAVTKKWEPYLDASIRKTELRLEKMKEAARSH